MPESQHTFPVFHPRANKVISFVCCSAEQEGPTASRLEASPYPPPCSKQREEVTWAPLGEGLPLRVVNSCPHTCSMPCLLSWWGVRAISALTVSRTCSWPGPLCGSPDPSIWSCWKSPCSLTSTSNPRSPTQIFSYLSYVFPVFPFSRAVAVHPLLNQNEGHHCSSCTVLVACQTVSWAGLPSPVQSPFTAVWGGLVQLWHFPSQRWDGFISVPSVQVRVWSGKTAQKSLLNKLRNE